MLKRQKQVIESFQRVVGFLATYPPPDPESYAGAKSAIEEILASLDDHSTAQVYGRNAWQAQKRRRDAAMRRLRLRYLRPIVNIAKAHLYADAGIAKDVRMPDHRASLLQQIAAAKALGAAAARFKPIFVKYGRGEDFLERLAEAIAEVESSSVLRNESLGRSAGARAGLALELRRGRVAVKALDAIVKAAFEGNDVVLRAWEVASRVGAPRGVSQASTDPSAASTPSGRAAA